MAGQGALQATKAASVGEFVAHWAKHDAADLKEQLSSSSRAVLVGFAEGLQHQVTAALQQLQQSVPEDADAMLSDAQEEQLETALSALRVAAQLCGELLQECHAAPPEALVNAAIQLHDHALLELGDVRPDVADTVAKLCCSWWQLGAANREFLVSQALPYLLLRGISTGKPAHVKACHAMRGALELLDFEDASINDMKRMLLQAAICPAFVSRPEGRKFLACLLTVHPSMVAEMTSVIRNQIPAGRRSVLDAYGEVILRGWREAAGACLPEIEASLIQNLMLAAIHGASQSLVASIRRVLAGLHGSKKLGGAGAVDAMLVRLYGPILFRGLAAANAGVRRNALQLLLDAFPLLDPEALTEEQDELLVRQFQALSDALTDPCPSVRVVAAEGICTVLNLYWEIIPSATTAGYVSRLTGQLAFDATMPAVRVAVLEGLQLLVDNQHAQPVLKRALPQLAPLMWDSSPRVREAMADLLLCISTSRGLHFWEVVPLDVLLGQLASEGQGSGRAVLSGGNNTAQKLHQLLVPSYFPGPEEGVARVAALLKEHPSAGQAFCRLLVSPFIHYIEGGKGANQVQVPLEDILQLAASLMGHLLEHPPVSDPRSPPRKSRSRRPATGADEATDGGRGGGRGKRKKAPAAAGTSQQQQGDDSDTEREDEVDVLAIGAQDETPETWDALLAGLSELCFGIGMALQHELCADIDLVELFPETALQQLLACSSAPAMQQRVWRIAECLPRLPASTQLLGSRLALLAEGMLPSLGEAAAASQEDAAAVLACLAAGPSGPKLAAMLCAALGLEWPDSECTAPPQRAARRQHSSSTDVAAAGTSTGRPRRVSAAADGDEDDDVACWGCGNSQPEDNMLLCDGCDAAFHTDCLSPPLEAVPECDWLCPGCCAEVRACGMARDDALRYLDALMLSDSGRQLVLLRCNVLQQALPLLQQRARGAAAAAAAAVGGAEEQVVAAAGEALACGLQYARAAVHCLSQGLEDDPAALARGAAGILAQLASSCSVLRQLPQRPACSGEQQRELLGSIRQLLGLLQDLWAALKLLGPTCLQSEPAVAAAAGAAAECGQSLLAGLAAVTEGLADAASDDEQDDQTAADAAKSVQGALALNTHLLRALVSLPQQPQAAQQQQLGSWLMAWLQLLSTSQLAAAGGVVKSDVPALLAALVPGAGAAAPGGRRGTSANAQQRQAGGGEDGQQALLLPPPSWLPVVARAAAEADEDEDEAAAGGSSSEADDDDTDADGDQAGSQGAGGAARKHSAKQPAIKLSLPPMVSALLAATMQKQLHPVLRRQCLALAVSQGQRGEWDVSLGAVRLSRALGAARTALSPGDVAALSRVRQQAAADNGGHALLLAEALGRLLPAEAGA